MRLCATCVYLTSEFEYPGGGCDTCGHGAGRGFVMQCRKEHFADAPRGTDDFYELLRKAQTCPDFIELTEQEIAKL